MLNRALTRGKITCAQREASRKAQGLRIAPTFGDDGNIQFGCKSPRSSRA